MFKLASILIFSGSSLPCAPKTREVRRSRNASRCSAPGSNSSSVLKRSLWAVIHSEHMNANPLRCRLQRRRRATTTVSPCTYFFHTTYIESQGWELVFNFVALPTSKSFLTSSCLRCNTSMAEDCSSVERSSSTDQRQRCSRSNTIPLSLGAAAYGCQRLAAKQRTNHEQRTPAINYIDFMSIRIRRFLPQSERRTQEVMSL